MLTIRPVRQAEDALLAELALERARSVLEVSGRRVPPPDLPHRVAGDLAAAMAADGARAYLALAGDRLAGYVVVQRRADDLTREVRGSVSQLYVRAPYRGRGVASRLLAAAEAWARENGAEQLEVEVLAAGRNRWGFSRKGYQERSRRLVKRLT